jgi:negative regulator of flagellin synthesis FlgM
MTRGINGIDLALGSATTAGTRQESQVGSNANPAQPNAANQSDGDVQITSTASSLAQLEQQLQSQPVMDAGRVARISSALASGTYSIDSQRIASGLLSSEQALSGL